MLKKLASLLFEEEEEVIETTDLNVEEPELQSQPDSMIKAMNPEVAKTKLKDLEVQHFEWPEVDTSEPVMREDSKNTQSEALKSSPKTYEFRPVISPIFGVNEKDLKHETKKPVEPKPYPSSSSRINTIISPIYGDLKQDDLHVEVEEGSLKVTLERSEVDAHALEDLELEDILYPTEEPMSDRTMEEPFADEELVLDEPSDLDADVQQVSLFDDPQSSDV